MAGEKQRGPNDDSVGIPKRRNYEASKVLLVLMGTILLAAGKLSVQHVKTHYDRSSNFDQYKTYSWVQVKTEDTLDIERIKNTVDGSLAAKGWTRVNLGGDVSILAIETTSIQQMHVSYDGITGGSGWVPGTGGAGGTETYKIGTVVVNLFDTKTKQLVWRGSSSDTISSNSNKNIQNLNKGVEKLLKQFPPGSSSAARKPVFRAGLSSGWIHIWRPCVTSLASNAS
jgi:hypothetical protein